MASQPRSVNASAFPRVDPLRGAILPVHESSSRWLRRVVLLSMRQMPFLVLTFTAAAVISGCSSGQGTNPTETSTPEAIASPTRTPRPTQEAHASPTTEATPTSSPTPRWTITCCKGSTTQQQSFTALADVWSQLRDARTCRGEHTGGGAFDALPEEQAVIDILAPRWNGTEKPTNVYGVALSVCAQSSETPVVLLYARAAAALCPEAPHGALLARLGDGSVFGDGSRLIGTDSPAGTYKTAPGVRDCYWEHATGNGEIIDNNFVTFAAESVTVTLNNGEGSTSDNCGRWTRQA